MNTEDTNSTHTQLLVYIASMVLRTQSYQRHLLLRIECLESAKGENFALLKKWFGAAPAHRLAEIELEGFCEQFPELARYAKEYCELSNFHFTAEFEESFNESLRPKPSGDGDSAG